MNKNDKLKEELAESRHDDLLEVALGAFGFAGVSIVLAYWQIQAGLPVWRCFSCLVYCWL